MSERDLKIKDGIIEGNPFFRAVDGNECAMWMIENRDWAMAKITTAFKEMGRYRRDHITECYDYIIYYFLSNNKKFDEDYFLNEIMANLDNMDEKELKEAEDFLTGEDEYKIEHYVLSMVKKIAMSFYTREVVKRELYLDDAFDEFYNPGDISEGYAILNSFYKDEYISLDDDPSLIVEFEELQDMYDNDLSIYDEDFRSKGLVGFDTKLFVTALFLKGLTTSEEISEYMGVSESVYETYKSGFSNIVKNSGDNGEDYSDLEDTIKKLIAGLSIGWEPR